MKKTPVFLTILLLSTITFGKVPKGKEYSKTYPDGKIKIKGQYTNGIRAGEWNYYDEKGIIYKRILYNPTYIEKYEMTGNKKNGVFKKFHIYEDKILTKGLYSNDIKTGLWEYINLKGDLSDIKKFNSLGKETGISFLEKDSIIQRNKMRKVGKVLKATGTINIIASVIATTTSIAIVLASKSRLESSGYQTSVGPEILLPAIPLFFGIGLGGYQIYIGAQLMTD